MNTPEIRDKRDVHQIKLALAMRLAEVINYFLQDASAEIKQKFGPGSHVERKVESALKEYSKWARMASTSYFAKVEPVVIETCERAGRKDIYDYDNQFVNEIAKLLLLWEHTTSIDGENMYKIFEFMRSLPGYTKITEAHLDSYSFKVK